MPVCFRCFEIEGTPRSRAGADHCPRLMLAMRGNPVKQDTAILLGLVSEGVTLADVTPSQAFPNPADTIYRGAATKVNA